jgi:FkbM family methyltransferase
MNRSHSFLAQLSFSAVNWLQPLSRRSRFIVKSLAYPAIKIARPIAKKLGVNHVVVSRLYGRALTMPAEHFLPATLMEFPQFNRPLSLAVEAIARTHPAHLQLAVVDVGANIGETVAIIEHYCPNKCSYLCVEPDGDLAELCEANHKNNARVRVERCCIGEEEGAPVQLDDDGRANPCVRLAPDLLKEVPHYHLMRLDTVATPFAKAHKGLSLIKIDTEGYDFSVLRSASNLLAEYKPAVYFEWFPRLLTSLDETVWSGFEYLAGFGYHYFVFFTSQGDFYCEISDPDRNFLLKLADSTIKNKNTEYFDVFASTDKAVRDMLISISRQ